MNFFNSKDFRPIKIIGIFTVCYLIIKLIDNADHVLGSFDTVYKLLFPFILAFIIAYILNPIVKLFEKKAKLPKGISIALTYVLFIGLIALGSFFVFPKLYVSIMDLIDSLPALTNNLQDKISELMIIAEKNMHLSQQMTSLNLDFNTIIDKFSTVFSSLFSNLLESAITITTSVVNIVFGFLISIYVLSDKELFLNFGKKVSLTLFGYKMGNAVIDFVKILNKMVGTYVGIKAIDSLIIGILAFIGLSILGSKYILLLSVIVFATNMIPYFGPFLGMAVTFFVNLFSVNLTLAIVTLIFLFLLQQFDAWYLDPHLIGNKVGLNAFLVILAVTIGGAIYGPLGMLLATPIASVIKIYTVRILNKYNYRTKPPITKSNDTSDEEIKA